MAYLIKPGPNSEPIEVKPSKGTSFKLLELQTFVDGYIEIIPTNDPNFVICINEDGKGRKLRRNPVATRMVRERIALDDYIVGPAVIGTAEEMGMDQ
jgi:hypothetical protein